MMTMTIDQKMDFLHSSFVEFDPETLFMILQENEYAMNSTFETLFQMVGQAAPPPPSNINNTSSLSHPNGRRGTPVTLPPDFLRLPQSHSHQQSSQVRSVQGPTDYLTLFSDPTFLAEMEKEFGPDFEAVLREHMQAEAMRNTSNYSTYSSDYHGYLQQQPQYPSQHQQQQQQQQYHQQQTHLQQQQQQQSPVTPYYTSNQSQETQPEQQQLQQTTTRMEGIGGGEDMASSSSNSVSKRFQGILSKFMPGSLLGRNYDEMSGGEEEEVDDDDIDCSTSFLPPSSSSGSCNEGVEMQSGLTIGRHENDNDDDNEEDSTSLLR